MSYEVTPYCEESDLVAYRGTRIDSDVAVRHIKNAAETIDMTISKLYAVPVDVTAGSPVSTYAKILLKKINYTLASGNLILEIEDLGEDNKLHAYGKYLVDEAMMALKAIADGSVVLPDVPPANPDDPGASPMPIFVGNIDPISPVESLYGYLDKSRPYYGNSGFFR